MSALIRQKPQTVQQGGFSLSLVFIRMQANLWVELEQGIGTTTFKDDYKVALLLMFIYLVPVSRDVYYCTERAMPAGC